MIKRFNVVTKKTYKKDGVDKTAWNNVGSLVAFEDGYALELSMFPETKFYVFDTEKKDSVTKSEQKELAKHDEQNSDGNENIPF